MSHHYWQKVGWWVFPSCFVSSPWNPFSIQGHKHLPSFLRLPPHGSIGVVTILFYPLFKFAVNVKFFWAIDLSILVHGQIIIAANCFNSNNPDFHRCNFQYTEGRVFLLCSTNFAIPIDLEKVFGEREQLSPPHISFQVFVAAHMPSQAVWRACDIWRPHISADVIGGNRRRTDQEEEKDISQVCKGRGTLCQYPFPHCSEALSTRNSLIKRNMLEYQGHLCGRLRVCCWSSLFDPCYPLNVVHQYPYFRW